MTIAFDLPPTARPGQPADTIDTPSLVLDLDLFAANVGRMQAAADRAGILLRPHAKAHKCPDISLAQIARGAVGICCQKVSEAIPFVRAGVRDIHISNEVASPAKAALLAELARHATLSVCVDDLAQVGALAAATAAAGSKLGVFVEVNVGQGRCGVTDPAAMLALVERIAQHGQLTMRGLQAYHGGIQHLRGWNERRDGAARAADRTGSFIARLDAAGVRCDVVTGGGSGSVEFDLASGVYTEIQPGSYVFMDADYGANDYAGTLRFDHSLFIATAVMSVAAGDRVVVDAGLKSMAVDSGLPWIWTDGARSTSLDYVAANDEHGIVMPKQEDLTGKLPALGSRMMLVPGHCDPTLNLYDEIVGIRGDVVESVWPISARGLSR
ncbi:MULTISPECIES: DSD1 family PLP-dependent enzyme [unclassified Cupriavidus]|uniref:DSD1 family PLP-dependent enzyme n=1 Tax=unclassified Cupriavidus TaxID=2640874 RepID=UPI001BFFF19E|nr:MULTISPECIES: DSD1 family PLP-dependent enzyme [unclassified Cupriavidus]MCA3186507.1 DSD1 family PLP-dependent enzyme [Cupriavidus sp.]MCA3188982.1 DSD1 family PLP-dependent enzyme [Cupriavidus sp.]MCA3198701.1 DSD1 family PLP-dependent enzyme [Cupriavidus sp.]MCA3201447.1 DSD1 family PLP-dependent enzyme [Cupriavidus sp.]MCA3208653.1 DSD1 family PLP-dependent enzyme [Cupriavidus sp.]